MDDSAFMERQNILVKEDKSFATPERVSVKAKLEYYKKVVAEEQERERQEAEKIKATLSNLSQSV